MERLPRIKKVNILVDRKVQLQFTDGVQREVDLRPYLRGPVFEAILKDDSVFRTVHVDAQLGTLTWDNGADMDPDVLYGSHIPTWMEKETFTKAI